MEGSPICRANIRKDLLQRPVWTSSAGKLSGFFLVVSCGSEATTWQLGGSISVYLNYSSGSHPGNTVGPTSAQDFFNRK